MDGVSAMPRPAAHASGARRPTSAVVQCGPTPASRAGVDTARDGHDPRRRDRLSQLLDGAQPMQPMTSRILSAVVVALVIGMAAASTFAHDGAMDDGTMDHVKMHHGDMAATMMATVDSNHDGRISAAEHAAHAQAMFTRMDGNHDGMVDKAELEAGMKAMHDDHAADDHAAATPAEEPAQP
jgi:hypothetical protein